MRGDGPFGREGLAATTAWDLPSGASLLVAWRTIRFLTGAGTGRTVFVHCEPVAVVERQVDGELTALWVADGTGCGPPVRSGTIEPGVREALLRIL